MKTPQNDIDKDLQAADAPAQASEAPPKNVSENAPGNATGNALGNEYADNTGTCPPGTPCLEYDHPADLAEKLESLCLKDQITLLDSLPDEDAAEALTEMAENTRVELLESLDTERAATLVSEMSPDDAADVLDELEEEHRDELLKILENEDSEDAEEIRQLMSFDPDTAAGIMNTEIVILEDGLTVNEAIIQLRSEIEDKEVPYYAYVVNDKSFLVGVVSLRDLLLAPHGPVLPENARSKPVVTVRFDQKREEVARQMSHYNFMALPVVDYEGRLLGAVTHDDVMDIMNDLASEDMLGMVGAGVDEDIDTHWFASLTMRMPWLVVNMLNSTLSAFVVHLFEGSISQMAMLAVLMPMVANQAGNTGQQALAVMIRQLATEKLDRSRARHAIKREAKISLVNGLLLSLLVLAGVFLVTSNLKLGMVMGTALMLDMLLGAVAGASIPLVLKRLGRDPAQASSIFLTTLTDGAGFLLFLSLATFILLQ